MPEVHREPVLGVHDLAPPEGRVTVQLLDERGHKVVKQEKSDNLVLNHWQECMKRMIRGSSQALDNSGSPINRGYAFHGATIDATFPTRTDADLFTTNWWTQFAAGLPVLGSPDYQQGAMQAILLSDSTVAADADENGFPGDLTAFCYLPENANTGNLKRTSLTAANCFRTPTALRYVCEWGTTFANGTVNSVGVGAVQFPASASLTNLTGALKPPSGYAHKGIGGGNAGVAQAAQVASGSNLGPHYGLTAASGSFFGTNQLGVSGNSGGTFNACISSGHRVSDTEYWVLVSGTAGNQLTKMDLITGVTTAPFTVATAAAGVALSGPTMTTIGAGTSRCGVAVAGTDLWLAYGTTLKRCVKPTTTSLTVSNTYTPSGVGTMIDITSDGTNIYWLDATKVWVISCATGAVTSSWTHGLTNTVNISYQTAPASQVGLMISWQDASNLTVYNSANTAPTHGSIRTYRFSVGGTSYAEVWSVSMQMGGSAAYMSSGLVMPLTADCKHNVGWHQGFAAVTSQWHTHVVGPGHVSRTVLGSPIVKTSANSMRVIYEFGF